MISSHVTITSSWNAAYPYSVSSALSLKFEDSAEISSQDEGIRWASSVCLQPSDGDTGPVTVFLQRESDVKISSLCVLTNARHMEVYDDRGEYVQTVRGEKGENEDTGETVYRKTIKFAASIPSCSMKFLSLTEKTCLKVYNLGVTAVKQKEEDGQPLPKRQIDMVKVRELLSSMSTPVPENVEHLMQTVEKYQENQSSVWSEVQQQAIQSAARNPSAASPMVGMLSMLARTGQMSNMAEDTNTVSDAVSKIVRSMVGTRGNDHELYNTLQGICRNVSQMRSDEKKQQRREKNVDENSEKEASGSEKENAVVGADNSRLPELLTQTIATQLTALEERMMGRLEKRLDDLESRLELRLNRIESVVEGLARSHREPGKDQTNVKESHHRTGSAQVTERDDISDGKNVDEHAETNNTDVQSGQGNR